MIKSGLYKPYMIGVVFLTLLLVTSCQKQESGDIPVSKVMQGKFYLDLYEDGEVEAINSTTISSPSMPWRYNTLKITRIVKDGKEVQAGDTVVVFDPSDVQKGIVDAESQVQISMAELEQLEAQQKSDLEGLKADYKVARIARDISEINLESANYKSEIEKKEIRLNLDKAKISLDRAKEQIDNKIKVQKEEVKQKKLNIEQVESQLKEAKKTLKKLFVVSPAPGIAIINWNWSTKNKFQSGDQCWSGQPLIQLPDLSHLRAKVNINEVDIAKIVKGQKVEIKPDAFSDSTYTGEVTSIANLAINKDGNSKIKVFPVDIKINESDEKLLPGLTVSCRIILGKIDDAIYVPLEAVHSEGDKYYVFVQTASGFKKVPVETGANNADYVVIKKGLNPNEKVALVDPFAKKDNKTQKPENETNNEI